LSRLDQPRMACSETDCLEMWRHWVNLSRGGACRVGLETDAKTKGHGKSRPNYMYMYLKFADLKVLNAKYSSNDRWFAIMKPTNYVLFTGADFDLQLGFNSCKYFATGYDVILMKCACLPGLWKELYRINPICNRVRKWRHNFRDHFESLLHLGAMLKRNNYFVMRMDYDAVIWTTFHAPRIGNSRSTHHDVAWLAQQTYQWGVTPESCVDRWLPRKKWPGWRYLFQCFYSFDSS
jgi:hypothetical protein